MSSQTVWDTYWAQENLAPSKDDAMCLFLATILLREFQQIRGRLPASSIEMGAGSGRTSRYLNMAGATTAILDVSSEALRLASFANQGLANPVTFHQMDIFGVTRESFERPFDYVWNAGVLEHFTEERQRDMIERMASIVAADGLVVLLTPYSRSVPYRIGKFILEKLNRFSYGREVPIATVRPLLPPGVDLLQERERSVGFVIFFFNGCKAMSSLPLLGGVGRFLQRLVNTVAVSWLRQPRRLAWILRLDRLLSRLFGGYLLLSPCRVRAEL